MGADLETKNYKRVWCAQDYGMHPISEKNKGGQPMLVGGWEVFLGKGASELSPPVPVNDGQVEGGKSFR